MSIWNSMKKSRKKNGETEEPKVDPAATAPVADSEDDQPPPAPDKSLKGIINRALSNLNEKQKQRMITIGAAVLFLSVVIGLVAFSSAVKDSRGSSTKAVIESAQRQKKAGRASLLSERVERDMWVAAEGQNIKSIQQSNEELRAQMNKLREDQETAKKQVSDLQNLLDQNKKNLSDELRKEARSLASQTKAPASNMSAMEARLPPIPSSQPLAPPAPLPQQIHGAPPPGGVSAAVPVSIPQNQNISAGIRIIGDENKKSGTDDRDRYGKKKIDEWLPTGAFFPAVLLNGIDAPTSGGAQSEPYPVLMSIKDLTRLPNRFQMDMRECFVIGAGYGNITDERAYIRTERLSCIHKNGQVIDFDLTGHVIGEDGKLGMRGRLISKQGQQIAMSLFAGTLGGFASAMKPTSNLKLDIGTDDTQTTTRANPKDVLASAALGGVGTSLDRVAQYYLRLAEKLLPIIEIDAGRTIEVVILKGRTMSETIDTAVKTK